MPDARRSRERKSRRRPQVEALSAQLRALIDANAAGRTEAERAQACEELLALANDLKPIYIVDPDRRRQPMGIREAKAELKALHKSVKRAADAADALTLEASLLLLEHSDRPIGIWRATLHEMAAQMEATMGASTFHLGEPSLRAVLAMETARVLNDDLGIGVSGDRIRDDAPLTQAPFAQILTVLLQIAGVPPDVNRTMKAGRALLADPFGDRTD